MVVPISHYALCHSLLYYFSPYVAGADIVLEVRLLAAAVWPS